MVFHRGAGGGQPADGSAFRGCGGVAAAGFDAVFQIDLPLFRDAHHGAGTDDTRENVFHHGAALVHHHGRRDAMFRKIIHNVLRAGAEDLLAAGESEINVVDWPEAPGDQIFRRGKDAVEGHLGVQGAAAPHDAVLDDGVKGWLVPMILFHGDDVIVRH